MSDVVLEVDGLTRRFGDVVANDQVDLRVRAGEVVGLLGHNGAGKTTLVSQVVGLLRPDSGSIRVAGVDAVAHPSHGATLCRPPGAGPSASRRSHAEVGHRDRR